MTDKRIYVGIENEFQLMKGDSYQNGVEHFSTLLDKYKSPFFQRSSTAIRTVVGSSLYIDGHEPEVCTPPIRVKKGFATKAADALYLARRELVDLISAKKSLDLIGFSMHWNLTSPLRHVNREEAMKALVVPYSLLTLTPISTGINMRLKEDSRLELLGDHLPDEDQVKAFLLFYAGSMLNVEANIDQLPLHYRGAAINNSKYDNPVPDGRYTPIEVLAMDYKNGWRNNKAMTISAQEYLQIYFEFFKEGFEELATPAEMKNLEDFVYDEKKLEIDKFKKYAFASVNRDPERNLALRNQPELRVDLDYYEKNRKLPDSTSKFLSACVKGIPYGQGQTLQVRTMDWAEIVLVDSVTTYSIHGIKGIEKIAELLAVVPVEKQGEYLQKYTEQAENNDNLFLENLPRKLRKRMTTALKKCDPFHLGEIRNEAFDTAAVLKLEGKVREYHPEEDDSIPASSLERAITIERGKFRWLNVFDHYDEMPSLSTRDKFYFILLGSMAGALIGAAVTKIYNGKPDEKNKKEAHSIAYTISLPQPGKNTPEKKNPVNTKGSDTHE